MADLIIGPPCGHGNANWRTLWSWNRMVAAQHHGGCLNAHFKLKSLTNWQCGRCRFPVGSLHIGICLPTLGSKMVSGQVNNSMGRRPWAGYKLVRTGFKTLLNLASCLSHIVGQHPIYGRSPMGSTGLSVRTSSSDKSSHCTMSVDSPF